MNYKLLHAIQIAVEDTIEVFPEKFKSDEFGYLECETEYQNGWNACIRSINDRKLILNHEMEFLSEEYQNLIIDLIENNELGVTFDDESRTVSMYINCNDVFAQGAADCEVIEEGDLRLLSDCMVKYGDYGSVAWCALKRKQKPIKQVIDTMKFEGIWTKEMEGIKEPEKPIKIIHDDYINVNIGTTGNDNL
jgi:hypothetical protein